MPTARPRHTITETPHIAAILDRAAVKWPELADRRARLLHKLLDQADATLMAEQEAELAEYRALVQRLAGSMPGVWPEGAIESLHDEWPE
ncbi:MAG: hypothetical protein LBR27_09265 [Bifidobacteriaceae bacterium]|jgi:hypothetical protein|nr:hypothetical protein [Bifidobacteriaceae bacterium]